MILIQITAIHLSVEENAFAKSMLLTCESNGTFMALSGHLEQHATTSRAFPLRNVGIVIPTYNAASYWADLHAALQLQGVSPDQVLVVDSSSGDDTRALVQQSGYRLLDVTKSSFGHGTTRQLAIAFLPDAEFLIYLTQDSIPSGEACLQRLISPFEDPAVGAVCGRQIARRSAGPMERHARLFNYPAVSNSRTLESRKRLGIKAAFLSNSFAAYRRSALDQVGGFPVDTIVNEDMTVAARLLLAGWKVDYQADAIAIHSHHFTLRQEFARYFDTGVYHTRERWLIEAFGGAGEEGRSFVVSELKYLKKANPLLIPVAILRNANKWVGYQLGMRERYLPVTWKKALSAQENFWRTEYAIAPYKQPDPTVVDALFKGSSSQR